MPGKDSPSCLAPDPELSPTPVAVHRRPCLVVGLVGGAVLGMSVLAAQVALSAHGLSPGMLLGLMAIAYLGAWGVLVSALRLSVAGAIARFASCSVSILIVLSAFELPTLVGVVDYRALFATPTPAWERPGNRPDPDLLFVREGQGRLRTRFRGNELEHLVGVEDSRIYEVDVSFDRDGFRNPADLDSAPVVVVGDSFVEGLHVEDGELMTARLADALDQPVANLGRSGYGPQQELETLRRHGLRLRPDVCVWAFYEGNDLADAIAYEDARDAACRAPNGEAVAGPGRGFTRNALTYVIRTWLDPAPPWPARRHAGHFEGHAGEPIPIYFANGDYRRVNEFGAARTGMPGLEEVAAVLEEADRLCRSQGIRLVVMFIPTKWRVYRDHCRLDPDAACLDWPLDELPRIARTTVAEISGAIDFLDLTPRFAAEADAGALLYLADDTHWSPEGHRVAAESVAELLGPQIAANPDDVNRRL